MKEGVKMPEDSKISKAQQKAVHEYVKRNYDRIELTVKPKGKKEEIKAHAELSGETLNSFINRAIDETMNREGNLIMEYGLNKTQYLHKIYSSGHYIKK